MHNIISIIFDFDDTLAPDSTSGFLEYSGVDVKKYWKSVGKRVGEGWDPVTAYLYKMIEESKSGIISPITRDKFIKWGNRIKLYNAANTIIPRIERHVSKNFPFINVEFYLISSGIYDILANTKISKFFKDIWSCDFLYNDSGEIEFPKNIVSFTDKTRYIYQISKGIVGEEYKGKPFEVNKKINRKNYRVPMDQMIFIGDGYTDIPCFSLVRNNGGIAIGVYDRDNREKMGKAWGFIEDGRVSNLVSANYGVKSDLTNSILMAVDSISQKINLRFNTYQG